MSSQRGNTTRQRPQKYKNTTAFKNDMHDKSNKTKMINNLQVNHVCNRCKEVIEWKIKYKKYKPLTQPKTCVLCNQKTVKRAYHVMCTDCGKKTGKCTKCCKSEEVVEVADEQKPFRIDREMKFIIKKLPERRRRTFNRYMDKKIDEKMNNEELREDLLKKLEELKVDDKDDDFELSGDEEGSSESEFSDKEDK
ncbi:uncharacterized protein C9orf85 homolog isoform X2 [Coccinella septempunctata]|uniref:uncharacterized protein C9orf85 homolog isoform X2 n=1 Tax=Coccinella septempunctata TaxID=41139 RepID=UPI001D079786|nr:uncharacterized protein C9orf85 homolog isoform X2 [Coccinella septempunctata]XP_044751549.1 uncharacterized protein C9orf85 homolog isoform X2 [Coccinella septempunctata]XP_044751550.1 uncharacterized protein C9orf85 homolog isoform X2 [Coccinella septempunctata]